MADYDRPAFEITEEMIAVGAERFATMEGEAAASYAAVEIFEAMAAAGGLQISLPKDRQA